MPDVTPELLSKREALRYFPSLSMSSLNRHIADGRIKTQRLGSRVLIPWSWLCPRLTSGQVLDPPGTHPKP